LNLRRQILFCLLGLIFSTERLDANPDGTPLHVRSAQIEVKANGILVHLFTDVPPSLSNITGWIQGKEWFYLTILEAFSDTAILATTPLTSPISTLQTINLPQSTQIALHLERTIDHFEIYTASTPPELLISLRYPVSEVLALLDTVNKEEIAPISQPTAYHKIRTTLYLAGTAFTIGGIILRSGKSNQNTMLFLGVGILIGTYLYDTYIRPRRDHGETITILRSILRHRTTSHGPFLPDKIPS